MNLVGQKTETLLYLGLSSSFPEEMSFQDKTTKYGFLRTTPRLFLSSSPLRGGRTNSAGTNKPPGGADHFRSAPSKSAELPSVLGDFLHCVRGYDFCGVRAVQEGCCRRLCTKWKDLKRPYFATGNYKGQLSADIASKRVWEAGIRRPCQVMRPQLFHQSKQEGSYSYSTPL